MLVNVVHGMDSASRRSGALGVGGVREVFRISWFAQEVEVEARGSEMLMAGGFFGVVREGSGGLMKHGWAMRGGWG